MSDDNVLRQLALKAGLDTTWKDQKGADHTVSLETLRAVITSLGFPCDTDDDVRNSLALTELAPASGSSHFTTARVGQGVVLSLPVTRSRTLEVELESGAIRSVTPLSSHSGMITIPPFEEPGYHRVRHGELELTVATAPRRALTIEDLGYDAPMWGLAAQIYSLTRKADLGIGDFSAAADFGCAAAAQGADMLALSPVHALFAAEPGHSSPYAASSRLVYNPLHADPGAVFGEDIVAQAIIAANVSETLHGLKSAQLIDWTAASQVRYSVYRILFAWLNDPARGLDTIRQDFERFRSQTGDAVRDHARFEALHGHFYGNSRELWSWQDWPPEFHDPSNDAVENFCSAHSNEVDFHVFAQWLVTKSFAECQRRCHDAGMRIGVISDVAVGMDAAGSHAWSRQHEILQGVSVGAPPDYYNADGQNWGLSTFTPRGLVQTRFAPFIQTLRACLRFAGGIRLDHVMGMSRLWVIPKGGSGADGAYLSYPSENLFRLIALESWRHKAVVLGEDLGTLPEGFRDYLRDQGIAGLRVLRFERDSNGYRRPDDWGSDAVAMTTTHDLVSTAGWWKGTDLEPPLSDSVGSPSAIRAWDRGLLWSAFERAEVASGSRPDVLETTSVVDAAVDFVGRTPCNLRLLSIEDALAIDAQPNFPGTTTEKPNWQHRLPKEAGTLLDDSAVKRRLQRLSANRGVA